MNRERESNMLFCPMLSLMTHVKRSIDLFLVRSIALRVYLSRAERVHQMYSLKRSTAGLVLPRQRQRKNTHRYAHCSKYAYSSSGLQSISKETYFDEQIKFGCSRPASHISRRLIYSRLVMALTPDKSKGEDKPGEYAPLDTRFNQYRLAYRYRQTMELLRGYLVYRLFSIAFLVNHQAKVFRLSSIISILHFTRFRSLHGVNGFLAVDCLTRL